MRPELTNLIDALLDDDLVAARTAMVAQIERGYESSDRCFDAIAAALPGPTRNAAIKASTNHLMHLSTLAGILIQLEGQLMRDGLLGPCDHIPDCLHPQGHWQSCYTGARV